MKKLALFVKVKAKPGKRNKVWQLWQEHVKPHVEDTVNLEVCCYCYDADDQDTIVFFEIFSDGSDFKKANQSGWFTRYQELVKPYLAAPSELVFAEPIWTKGVAV